jgi:spore coat polysaccharide biosynthesis protein SpsF (cytidylyltransferase family)
MKVVAIIQARMGSSRLPNKVMANIRGMPMIHHVLRRAYWAETLAHVMLAIPDSTENDALEYFAVKENIHSYRGPEEDLLGRTLGALAELAPMDGVVRITGDCPMIDSGVIDQVVERFSQGDVDYCSNVFPIRTYPAGIAVECYSTDLLHRLDREIETARYREYYMAYVWDHASQFEIVNVEWHSTMWPEDISGLRWTVDEQVDLDFVKAVYNHLGWTRWGTSQVLELLWRCPELEKINAHIPIDPFHGLEKR